MYQHYVYILSEGTRHDSVYPNFKLAYERLEEIANGKQISPVNDNEFEIITIQRDARHREYYGHVSANKYSITRKLITINNADDLVTTEMVNTIIKNNKRVN